ncbi:DUF4232 domain-containing protein [Streptomyces ziwulingensis]|uniref:DUF4232 domain-containing protein n=1 Tax=Streptomyces ziwulingensis TaxID=1045501 RepID=A0ABP9BQY9_9ACTN
MRSTRPIALAACVAATLLLTSCAGGDGDDDNTATGTDDGATTTAACKVDEVGVDVAASPAPAAGDTGTVTVSLTGQGAECVLEGFPQVTLTAAGTAEELSPDEGASEQRLTLAEGTTAAFTVTYVRGEDGGDGGLAVQKARFALPGADTTRDVDWSYGAVAAKADGSGPDATVSAFQQAGD